MMFKKLATMMITAAVAVGFAMPSAAAKLDWTFQSSDRPGIFMYQMAEEFSGWVNEMSKGEIKINVAPTGSVVQYNETMEAVGAGILQGEFTDPSYFAGQDLAFGVIGNTVGAWGHPSEALKFMRYGGGMEIFQELYDRYNVHLVGVVVTGVEAFVSKKPLRGVADLKGLKMRAPEGMVQNVFAAAGAAPVNLPGSEVYTSLEKGVIDAADFSLFSVNQKQGMNDVARYPLFPGFHSMPLQVVTLNKDIWNSLTKNQQTILETAVWRLATEVAWQYEMQDLAAVKEARSQGIEVINWPDAERAKFRNIAREQWDKVTGKSPVAKKYIAAVVTYLSSQGLM
ncbi:TRAP transporter substrate-binding protein [Desulfoluna spongiiphila]|uniref:TRAP-type mannitol/chloroaromatic compound transport system, substrate-binding protein n=1 Tax=Desulfoluna spongiiphila TaxID=419481 RepID=A0A1G5I978_9BACT|nr:TRAP transporter substrate-binding protein [Desulfoluna spongiiphila]SCY72603.1 TRAP-type mannitol/chloroaromatic compound transport system, substrate-binding protein [Desulfoluna spongiiphila]VVS93181.1 trap transporter solute receptor dctp/teaa [Desulfoluna spongiiphila]